MMSIKQHGDGLKNLEAKTLFYGEQMLKAMGQYKGSSFEPGPLIHKTLTHITLVLMFGQSAEEDASDFLEDQHNMETVLRPAGAYFMLDIFPFLRYLVPHVRRTYKKFTDVVRNSHTLYDKHITAQRKLYKHPNVAVFIDHFFRLNIINEFEDSKKHIDIRPIAVDIFTAGMATTSKTLQTLLALMVNYPKIQDTISKEIENTIGRTQPTMEDKNSMPFTQAVILETLRHHTIGPFLAPHLNRHDCELQGCLIPAGTIPAGTIVFPNVWALHHDPRYWKNPWEFNPNRWLENGKVVTPDHIKKQRLLAFGAGRRQCPGEVFARNRLFIVTTMLLQKFKFVPAEGHPRPNHDPSKFKLNILLHNEPYKLSVQPRY